MIFTKPRHHHTDGAYFGTGFPHMLFMVHPEYRPKRPANQVFFIHLNYPCVLFSLQFVPRLYGFKIHPLAYQIQQQAAANFKVFAYEMMGHYSFYLSRLMKLNLDAARSNLKENIGT